MITKSDAGLPNNAPSHRAGPPSARTPQLTAVRYSLRSIDILPRIVTDIRRDAVVGVFEPMVVDVIPGFIDKAAAGAEHSLPAVKALIRAPVAGYAVRRAPPPVAFVVGAIGGIEAVIDV